MAIDAPSRTDADTMLAACRRFVDDVVLPNVAAWDREDVFGPEVLQELSRLAVAGAMVPAAYGGPGLTVAELVPIWRTLSHGWISITGAVNPTGLAIALLVRHGTEEQRRRWLPQFASGEAMASFSITEPQAGSDMSRLATSATRLEGGGLEITGRKRWVAGGHSSVAIFTMMRVEGSEKPSCVILPAEGRGGDSWQQEPLEKIGYRGVESAAYVFDHLRSTGAEVLGGDDMTGKGARQMLDALDVGRVNVACRALGVWDRAIHCATTEARGRGLGPGVLGDFSHTQMRIGEQHAGLMAAEALVDRAAALADLRHPNSREVAAAAKVVCSDGAVRAVEAASRLAASRSYSGDDELSRLRRDAPQTQIGEGANDVLLLTLGRARIKAGADWHAAND